MLFTDIVGSTALRERLGEDRADAFQLTHDALLTDAVTRSNGEVVKGLGDGIMAVFTSAADAVEASIQIQRAVHTHTRTSAHEAFEVRVGISTGDVMHQGDDYFGAAVVEAARLCDAAQAEQILVADLVRALSRGRGGIQYESVGELDLKGLDGSVAACFVAWEPLAAAEGGTVPYPPLLHLPTTLEYAGRPELLTTLNNAWQCVVDGEGSRTILLAGEPGVGKTRTASEVAKGAFDGNALVLYGRCDEELGLPYAPFVEALDYQTRNDPTLSLGRYPGDLRRLVADLEVQVADLPPAIRSEARAEEHRLMQATATWITEVSRDRGLVLVIDDLHWARMPTLQMLVHIVREASADPDARLLVLGTYRDTDIDRTHPLADVMGEMRRLPGVERISVDPLTQDEVISLIESAAGHELDETIVALARRTHAETEGNPFFVGEVLRHFIESGVVRLDQGRWSVEDPDHIDVPEGVRDVVGRRLNRLSEAANTVLTAAAVIGRDFDMHAAAAVARMSVDDVLDALDESVRARLVEEVSADQFRFAHALTRQTLYEEVSATRRRQLHRRVVAALEEHRATDLSALAHHSIAAGPVGGDFSSAITYTIAAGEQALAARAGHGALRLFDQAIELAEESQGHDPVDELRARRGLGQAQRDTGHPDFNETLYAVTREALALGEHALAIQSSITNGRGMANLIGAVDDKRVADIESVLAIMDGSEMEYPLLLAALAGELGQAPLAVDRRLQLVDDARERAERTGDLEIIARVLYATANANCVPDRLDQQVSHARRAVDLASRIRDPPLQCTTWIQMGLALINDGEIEEGRDAYQSGVLLAKDEAGPIAKWQTDSFDVQHLAWDGNFDAAREASNDLLARGMELGMQDAPNWWGATQLGMSWADGSMGDLAEHLQQMADAWPDIVGYRQCALVARLMTGDQDEEIRREVIERDLLNPDKIPLDMFTLTSWDLQATLTLRLDLPEHAGRLLALAQPHRHRWGSYGVWVYSPVSSTLMRCHAVLGNEDATIEEAQDVWSRVSASPAQSHLPAAAEDIGRTLLHVGGTKATETARPIIQAGITAATEMKLPRQVAWLTALAEALPAG